MSTFNHIYFATDTLNKPNIFICMAIAIVDSFWAIYMLLTLIFPPKATDRVFGYSKRHWEYIVDLQSWCLGCFNQQTRKVVFVWHLDNYMKFFDILIMLLQLRSMILIVHVQPRKIFLIIHVQLRSIKFARLVQIFYPFSLQTHPHSFPGLIIIHHHHLVSHDHLDHLDHHLHQSSQ